MIQEINESNYKAIISQNDIVVVDFWADWCSHCKAMLPKLEALSNQTDAMCCSVDIDENPDITNECNIKSLPTVLIYVKGEEVKRFVGSESMSNIKTYLSMINLPE